MPGEGLTHGPPAEEKAGGSHHRCSRINRHSLRDVWRLIRALLGDRLDCLHPRDAKHHRVATTQTRCAGASTGAPGPHDFTVRIGMFVGV